MKSIKYLLSLSLLVYVFTIVSCGEKTPKGPTAEEAKVTELSKSWSVGTGANSVTFDGVDRTDDYTDFSLTITSQKSYTATGGFSPIWPASGTWDFGGTADTPDLNTILRSDNVQISIASISENALQLSFTYTTPGSRVKSTDGDWIFTFTAN